MADALRDIGCRADNSLRRDHDLGCVDACVFAGTPEWLAAPVEKLVAKLAAGRLPVAYVGLGYGEYHASAGDSLGEADAAVLRRAGLVTTRDRRALDFLARHGIASRLLPCPALFACRDERPVDRVRRVAISLQNPGPIPGDSGPQTISPQTARWLLDFATLAAAEYELVFVLHYVDEFAYLSSALRRLGTVRYSCEPADYQGFYRGADLTVTSRVHGAGICASLGIPAYYVGDSLRTDTVAGFLSEVVPAPTTAPAALLDAIRTVDIGGWSRRIIEHKRTVRAEYQRLLGDFLSPLAAARG
jgi:hypothetical protein